MQLAIPEDLRAKLDLLLFSEVEGRVPFGAYSAFIMPLVQAEVDRQLRGIGRTTLCWQCSKSYEIMALKCPECGAANANTDYGRAMLESIQGDKNDSKTT
jgi:hypothetical protein